MLAHTTLLISKMDPIKYFQKPALIGRVACWKMVLTEYDIQYVMQKAIKGSVISNCLTHQPIEDYQPMCLDFHMRISCLSKIAVFQALRKDLNQDHDKRSCSTMLPKRKIME